MTSTISVRLSDELTEAVDQFAATRSLKASEAVRELIQLGLRAHDSAASERDFPIGTQLNVLFEDLKQDLMTSHENVALACLQASHEAAEAVWALVQLQAKAQGRQPPPREQLTELATRRLSVLIAQSADESDAEQPA